MWHNVVCSWGWFPVYKLCFIPTQLLGTSCRPWSDCHGTLGNINQHPVNVLVLSKQWTWKFILTASVQCRHKQLCFPCCQISGGFMKHCHLPWQCTGWCCPYLELVHFPARLVWFLSVKDHIKYSLAAYLFIDQFSVQVCPEVSHNRKLGRISL